MNFLKVNRNATCELIRVCSLSEFWNISAIDNRQKSTDTNKVDPNQIKSIVFKASLTTENTGDLNSKYMISDSVFDSDESQRYIDPLNKLIENTCRKKEEFLVGFFVIWKITVIENENITIKYGIVPKILTNSLMVLQPVSEEVSQGDNEK